METSRRSKSAPVLTPDKSLQFPEFVLLKASAGSGKTYALSLRFVQFLLSDLVRKATTNALPNILAITFTKNAAREMKERILAWLKGCYFGEKDKSKAILEIVTIAPDNLPQRAGQAIEGILSNYTDFQVETIDSFMATIFKASIVDLGYSPDFEIVLDNSALIEYAFSRYLRKVTPSSEDGEVFERILGHILGNLKENASYAWDPTSQLLEKIIALYTKLAAQTGKLAVDNFESIRKELQKKITSAGERLSGLVEQSGCELSVRGHCHSRILPAIRQKRFTDLIGASFKTAPIKKPKSGDRDETYQGILKAWGRLEELVNKYRSLYARDFFYPYLIAHLSFAGTLDRVKRQKGIVFIEDINKQLARYIDQGIVPDIYFRLGDRIVHFLIDEFQDTSPIQWLNMVPLIENSLAQNGSLFIVGDTKQAIYGFRDADYSIMKGLEGEAEPGRGMTFPSVVVQVRELMENYRSHEKVMECAKAIFLKRLIENEDLAEYNRIAARSGLNDFHQEAIPKHKGKGYVEYILLDESNGAGSKNENGDPLADEQTGDGVSKETEDTPEKKAIQDCVQDLKKRGYGYSDIAILTYKNDSVVNISSWLNEKEIPFIPYSSLDIRMRKIIGEILALLRFLDSPPDDLSFSTFLLGDMLRKRMERDGCAPAPDEWHRFLFECRQEKDHPLYIAFRKHHPQLWDRYLEQFFKTVGYYPLYDLVTLIFRVFDVFALFPDEEGALTKLLEAIKEFEGMGKNDLREFLEFTGDLESGESNWTIDVPSEIDAVRVMSIHKAKGLGFPVVILLLYGERFLPSDFYLDADGESVRVLKITKDLAQADSELAQVLEKAQVKEKVDRLNTLYVALTRAKAELHIIGVKGRRATYPFNLIGDDSFASADKKPDACPEPRGTESPRAEKERFAGAFELPPNRRESLNYENIRRGEIAHSILAEIEFLRGDWEDDIKEIIKTLFPQGPQRALGEEIGRTLVGYFQGSPLEDHFVKKEGRRVLREFSCCDATGAVNRMDRIVIDKDAVSVIDFKTGKLPGPEKQADREQVQSYIRIIKEICPEKAVRGMLAYIDEGKWERVE